MIYETSDLFRAAILGLMCGVLSMTDGEIIKWFLLGVAVGGAIVYVFWMMFYREQIESFIATKSRGINNGR